MKRRVSLLHPLVSCGIHASTLQSAIWSEARPSPHLLHSLPFTFLSPSSSHLPISSSFRSCCCTFGHTCALAIPSAPSPFPLPQLRRWSTCSSMRMELPPNRFHRRRRRRHRRRRTLCTLSSSSPPIHPAPAPLVNPRSPLQRPPPSRPWPPPRFRSRCGRASQHDGFVALFSWVVSHGFTLLLYSVCSPLSGSSLPA